MRGRALLGELVLVTWVFGAYEDDPLLMDEEDESYARVVRLFTKKPPEPPQEYDGSMAMRDRYGGEWMCRFPVKRRRDDEDPVKPPKIGVDAYTKWRAESADTHCATAPHRGGQFWGYEICVGKIVRQYQIPPRTKQPPGRHEVLVRYTLGMYRETEEEYASYDDLKGIFPAALFHKDDGVASWPSRRRSALMERYVDGTENRSATAYIACLLAESEVRSFSTASSKMAERARTITRSDAGMYAAKKVRIVAVVEQPEKEYHILVAAPTFLCHTNDFIDATVGRETKVLKGACLRKKLDWWTYEVCVGKTVRQFHASQDDGSILERDRQSGFLIGTFKSEDAVLERNLRDLGGPRWRKGFESRLHYYTAGDVCDLTGTPRSARVSFRCDPESRVATKVPFIVSVVETMTCEYDILVAIPAACHVAENDDLSPVTAANRRYLDCEKVETTSTTTTPSQEEDDPPPLMTADFFDDTDNDHPPVDREDFASDITSSYAPPVKEKKMKAPPKQPPPPPRTRELPPKKPKKKKPESSSSSSSSSERPRFRHPFDAEGEPGPYRRVEDPNDPLAPLDIDDEDVIPRYAVDDGDLDIRDDEL